MLENLVDDLDDVKNRLNRLAPAGYTFALNVRYFTPEFYYSTYPDEWVKRYTEGRYALFDPVTIWCRTHTGKTRWSEINIGILGGPGRNIMQNAKEYDLLYGGAVASRGPTGAALKSLIFGARNDRELTDDELEELSDILEELIAAAGNNAGLSDVELEVLGLLADGLSQADIAEKKGVSSSTIKARIDRARVALGAKNAVQAVAIAAKRGLILPHPVD